MELIVPVRSSAETKYFDWPGAANHRYSLAVPGVVMITGFDEMERPVPYKPTSLIGAGLQPGGWQMA